MLAGVMLAAAARSVALPFRVNVPAPGGQAAAGHRQAPMALLLPFKSNRPDALMVTLAAGAIGSDASRLGHVRLVGPLAAEGITDGQAGGDRHAARIIEQQGSGVDGRRAGVGVGCRAVQSQRAGPALGDAESAGRTGDQRRDRQAVGCAIVGHVDGIGRRQREMAADRVGGGARADRTRRQGGDGVIGTEGVGPGVDGGARADREWRPFAKR